MESQVVSVRARWSHLVASFTHRTTDRCKTSAHPQPGHLGPQPPQLRRIVYRKLLSAFVLGAVLGDLVAQHARIDPRSRATCRHAVDDSRSLELDTDGYGVDIVLNSVIGTAPRAGLELLALSGRFVEIAKRGIYPDTGWGSSRSGGTSRSTAST
jgi:hypothetical protein